MFLVFLIVTFGDTSWLLLVENGRDPLIREASSIFGRHFLVAWRSQWEMLCLVQVLGGLAARLVMELVVV